jgi:hypothetical protein
MRSIKKGITRTTDPMVDMSLSEKELAQNIIREARLLCWRVHYAWTSVHSPRGWLDLVLCRLPVILFVELKSEAGKLTTDQQSWLQALRGCGLHAYVWRPSDLEAMNQILISSPR